MTLDSSSGPELGTVLALLRIAAGWSEDGLARASGLRRNSISQYEQGLMLPGLNSIVRMLGTMGYPFGAVDLARTCIEILRLSRTSHD